MTVQEAIIELLKYNQQAQFGLVINNRIVSLTEKDFSFGGSEGSSKLNCDDVNIYVDSLNTSEAT